MDLDDRAVHRHDFQLETDDPLPLQLLEHPVEHAVLRPAVHPGINGVPVAEPRRQTPPLAAVLGHIQNSVEHIQIRQPDVAALHRKIRRKAGVLSFCNLHGGKLA